MLFGFCRVVRDNTLAECAAEFVAALQQIAKLPLSDCVPTNRYMYFVLRNRAELHENFQITLVGPRLNASKHRGLSGARPRLVKSVIGSSFPMFASWKGYGGWGGEGVGGWEGYSHPAVASVLSLRRGQDGVADLLTARFSTFDATIYIVVVCVLVAETVCVVAPIVAKVSVVLSTAVWEDAAVGGGGIGVGYCLGAVFLHKCRMQQSRSRTQRTLQRPPRPPQPCTV